MAGGEVWMRQGPTRSNPTCEAKDRTQVWRRVYWRHARTLQLRDPSARPSLPSPHLVSFDGDVGGSARTCTIWGAPMTEFQQTIVALTAIRNSIERAVLCLYSAQGANLASRPDRTNDRFLTFTLQNHIQILLCSFLEEWRIFSSFGKGDARVKETLQIVSPAIDQFRRWSGLHKIRSSLLAHSPRDTNGRIVFPWVAFRENRCPTTLEETLLLALCALMSVDNVKERHKAEQAEAEKALQVPLRWRNNSRESNSR